MKLTLAVLGLAFSLTAFSGFGFDVTDKDDPNYNPIHDPTSDYFEMNLPDDSLLIPIKKETPAEAAVINGNFTETINFDLGVIEFFDQKLIESNTAANEVLSIATISNQSEVNALTNRAAIELITGVPVQSNRLLQDYVGETVGIVVGETVDFRGKVLYMVILNSGLLISVDITRDVDQNTPGFQTPILAVAPLIQASKFITNEDNCGGEYVYTRQSNLILQYLALKQYGGSSIFIHSNYGESSGAQTGVFTLSLSGFEQPESGHSGDSILNYISFSRRFDCVTAVSVPYNAPYMTEALATIETIDEDEFEGVFFGSQGYSLVPGIAPFKVVDPES